MALVDRWWIDPGDVALADVVLAAAARQPRWMRHAACRQPEHADINWFPTRGTAGHRQTAEAVAVCAQCSVRQQCLAFALELDAGNPVGVYGGLSPTQRLAARRTAR
jgi:WhiB family transcriptional regulator, redox-sensing transcriptional regulator